LKKIPIFYTAIVIFSFSEFLSEFDNTQVHFSSKCYFSFSSGSDVKYFIIRFKRNGVTVNLRQLN